MNIQADGAGIPAFPGIMVLQPAPLLNRVVRPRGLPCQIA